MGFGLLLCAYFLLTFMSVGIGNYCFVTYIAGVMVTARAVGKLRSYNPRFRWLYPVALVYALLGIYYLLVVLGDLFLWPTPDKLIVTVTGGVQLAAEFVYAVIALWSAAEVAASVDLERHRTRALRNLIFTVFWGAGELLLALVPALAVAGNGALTKVLFLYRLVVYLFNAFALYGCFTAICPAGEEFGKPSKPSRFRFINDMNQKLDEKNERARLEYEKMMEERNKKYSAKNNNRHHKKKK